MSSSFFLTLTAILCLVFLAPASSGAEEPAVDLPANLIRVPLVRQATDYTCGAAALQSVLGYFGQEFREDELARAVGSNSRIGTPYRRIESFALKNGYKVEIEKNMTIDKLKEILNSGKPVVCLLQAWPLKNVDFSTDWDDGHYVVACGYDDRNLYFMDPSMLGSYAYVPEKEFLVRWHDTDGKEKLVHFGMIISKPGWSPALDSGKARKMN